VEPLATELVEAEIRRLMAKHSAINPRGWSSGRERATLHRIIDQYLDEHALLAEMAPYEAEMQS
jgi:hypothetical protein